MEKLTRGPIVRYGDIHDGVIEFPAIAQDGNILEVGYFYGDIKPKNIICISAQAGCISKCAFCEVGREGFKRNLTASEMHQEVSLMIQTAKEFNFDADLSRHKVSISKTGEPLANPNLMNALELIAERGPSFKISTVFPRSTLGSTTIEKLAHFSLQYKQPVQMQISFVSTSEDYRRKIIGIDVAQKEQIRDAAQYWYAINPNGRKFNLSFILAENTPCEVKEVSKILTPELVRFRFRPYVPTVQGKRYGLRPISEDRMRCIKQEFEKEGYEVGDWATPTKTEENFGLVANVTRQRYLESLKK